MQTKIKNLDGIARVQAPKATSVYITPLHTPKPRSVRALVRRHAMPLAVATLMVVSFAAGMITVLSGAQTPAIASDGNMNNIAPRGQALGTQSQTLDFLSDQFGKLLTQYEEHSLSPQEFPIQKQKLKSYLASRHSPWASDDQTLDALLASKNMRMILAISFVEGNFGQHCSDNNCSGIGVDPSVGSWRKYKTVGNWVLDFNRLLERRYKNWTPEEMRGVYVNPGSDAWVSGIHQVLSDLDAAGIK